MINLDELPFVVSRADKVLVDQKTVGGDPRVAEALMERAGMMAAEAIFRHYGENRRAVIVCGKGNNGGDGLVVARGLLQRGWEVTVVISPNEGTSVQHRHNRRRLEALLARRPHRTTPTPSPIVDPAAPSVPGPGTDPAASNTPPLGAGVVGWGRIVRDVTDLADVSSAIWIDAILGTGQDRPLVGQYRRWMDAFPADRTRVVALDAPSDLIDGALLRPSSVGWVISFGAAVPEVVARLAYDPALRIDVVDIGFDRTELAACSSAARWLAGVDWAFRENGSMTDLGAAHDATGVDGESAPKGAEPARAGGLAPAFSVLRSDLTVAPRHKYEAGCVVVIGGAVGMTGAPILAAQGALAVGAGLVHVFVPQDVYSAVAPSALDTLVHPLNLNRDEATWEKTLQLDANVRWETRLGADGSDVPSDAAALAQALRRATAVVIGPGLGRTSFVAPLVGYLYRHVSVPMVLDADALHLVDLDVEPSGLRALTPHWGEFRSLCMRHSGMKASFLAGTPDEYQHSVSLLRRMISMYPVQVLLKGNPCLFANREMDVLMDTRGLDVVRAGLGDVLAGSIGGLLSQGEEVMGSMMKATLLGRLAVARMRVENGPRYNPLASQLPGYIQRVLGDDRGN